MSRRLLSTLPILLLLLSPCLFAQKEATVWHFGNGAGLDFSSGSPVAVGGGMTEQEEGCASISDRNTGQLLFYTDGMSVWNRNHGQMSNGFDLFGDSSSTQSAFIIPMPGDNDRYYIFTADAGPYKPRRAGICWSTVDMRLNGGLGDVVSKNVRMFTPAVEKLTGVRHCNGVDYWVIAHEWGSSRFRSYLVTADGVSTAPVVSIVGSSHNGGSSSAIGNMKASPNGRKLAVAIMGESRADLLDFDPRTGVVSNPIYLSPITGSYGVAFSPDNSKLYIVSGNFPATPPSDTLFQYDLSNSDPNAIRSSRMRILTLNGGFIGSMQNGPDGKIYVARYGNTIGAIEDPNEEGLACNYTHNAVSLGTGTSTDGLPNFFEHIFNQSPEESPCLAPEADFTTKDTTICEGACISFFDMSKWGPTRWEWSFEGSNTVASTDRNPMNICYGRPGVYKVRLVVSKDGLSDTAEGKVTVVPVPVADAGRDTTICVGDSAQLTATGEGTYSWSPQAGLSCTNCPTPKAAPVVTTTYRVTVRNALGCIDVDSVKVTVSSISGVDAGASRTICAGGSVRLSAAGGTSYTWIPSYGLSCDDCASPTARPDSTTLYTVIARNATGCSGSDTVTVFVHPKPKAVVSRDTMICLGDSVRLSVAGGALHRWSPSAGLSCDDCAEPFARPAVTTTYRAVAESAAGCLDTAFVTVTVAEKPDVSIDDIPELCEGESIQLHARGSGRFQWNSSEDLSCLDCPDPIVTPQKTTEYRVHLTTGSGCWDTAWVTVVVHPNTVVSVSPDQWICVGDTTSISASGGTFYSWEPAEGLSCTDCETPLAYPTVTTSYRVIASGPNGCPDTGSVTVTVNPRPAASAGEDVEYCAGGSARLTASGGAWYSWSPAEGLSCTYCPDPIASPSKTTEYTVVVTSADGCTAEDKVTVRVREPKPIRAHIAKTHTSSSGWIYTFPVVLTDRFEPEEIRELTFKLTYDNGIMQLINGTPSLIASMLRGTLLEGWNIKVEEAEPGSLLARITAPDGVMLRDTGTLLSVQCRMFVGKVAGTELPFEISLAGNPCAFMVVDPGYIRVDSICGLNQRLIEIGDATYALEGNRPNPFNPATEIRFSVGLDGDTRLTVYDPQGGEVAVLVDQRLEPGAYSVTWDASGYPSGLYYYRLVSGEWSGTGSMLLVK